MRPLIEQPRNRNADRLLVMDARSAKHTRYAANTMLTTKISLINEITNLAEHPGADLEQVRHGIGSDPHIGQGFIYAGCGYGGSCLPKDVRLASLYPESWLPEARAKRHARHQ